MPEHTCPYGLKAKDLLRRSFSKTVRDPKAITHRPVIAVFAMMALMALAASYAVIGTPFTVRAGEWFIAFSMCVLAYSSSRTSRVSRRCS